MRSDLMGCFVTHLHEQESNRCPKEFSDTADDADEYPNVGRHAHLGDRHGKTTFSASELKRQEEKEVGEKTGERKDEESIDERESSTCVCMEEQEHEEDFEALKDTSHIFEGKTAVETFLVL